MTNPMLAELDEVVRLMEAATPGKWSVEPEGDNEFGQPVFTIEIFDGTCPIVGSGAFYGDPHDANACVAAVNFLRTHHATLADMAKRLEAAERDSKRLDWLADPANLVGNVQLPASSVTANLHSLRAAIDHAMNLCMESDE